MPFNISDTKALGRTFAAARMMAGIDQNTLAIASGVSAATISNVERGESAREDTLKAIRRALSRKGVLVAFSKNNGLATVVMSFAEESDDDSDE